MEQEQIAALVKQNDNAARRALFEEFYQRTFAAVFQIVRSRETAEDLAQDAFVKAFHNLPKLREAKKFGAWLMAIATNLARNHLKREKRLVYADDFSYHENNSGNNTEEEALRELEITRVRAALRTLPPDQYQVIILQDDYDLKIEEIAAMLEISPGTVKSRLFRAREKLARQLEPKREKNTLNGREEVKADDRP